MKLTSIVVFFAWSSVAGNAFAQPPGTSIQISGTVRTASAQPMAGVSVVFTTGQAVVTDNSGNYSAIVLLGFSGTATPSLAGYSFSPPNRSYSNVTASQSGHDYTASPVGPIGYSISGSVRTASGQGLSDVTISFSNGGPSPATDANGNYAAMVRAGYSGTATPSRSGYSFTPSNRSYNSVSGNQISQDFAGTATKVCSYTLGVPSDSVGSGPGAGSVLLTTETGCAWTATSNASWITVTNGTNRVGSGFLDYTFLANTGSARSSSISFPGQAFTLNQAGAATQSFTIYGTVRTASGQGLSDVLMSFSNGGPSSATDANGNYAAMVPAGYSGTVTPSRSGYSFSPSTRSYANVNANAMSEDYTGTLAIAAPSFSAAGVTNGASFVRGLTPSSIVTVFGTGLSNVRGIVSADMLPLPTQLSGTSVTVNGTPAPLFAVANVNGQEQINLQVPHEATDGVSTATVVVNNNGRISSPVQLPIFQTHPGIFTVDGIAGAVLHGSDYLPVTLSNPATKGEVILVYATGLGSVIPAPPSGVAASVSPLSFTKVTPLVRIGGTTAPVLFSGLAPGFVGLYQINIQIPINAPTGFLDLLIETGGQSSNVVKIPVYPPGSPLAPVWTQTDPVSTPGARGWSSMVFDKQRQQVLLFGGQSEPHFPADLNDTWVWDGTNWTQQFPANSPPPRMGAALASDSTGRILLFGGLNFLDRSSDTGTWLWDGTNWTQRNLSVVPPARLYPSMTFDASRRTVVLFGGESVSSGLALNDTWVWDGTIWTQKFPTNSPPARGRHAMAFDAAHQEVVLFGGRSALTGQVLNDTWVWDGIDWKQRTPSGAPGIRDFHGMTWDGVTGRILLFGGATELGEVYSDTWVWDGLTWVEATPAAKPAPRFGHAMTYDGKNGKVVIFGSNCCGLNNETWLWGIR